MPLISCPRVLTATAGQVMYNVPFCLSLELVGPKEKVPCLPWITYKTLLGNLAQVPFALFEALISLVARPADDHRSHAHAGERRSDLQQRHC